MSGNDAWNRNVLNADGRMTETGLMTEVGDTWLVHVPHSITACVVVQAWYGA